MKPDFNVNRPLVEANSRRMMNEILGTIQKIDVHIAEQKAVSVASKAFAERERNREYVSHGKEDRKEG